MKYKNKPVEIEAIQYVGTNYKEIFEFMKNKKQGVSRPDPKKSVLHIHTPRS